ncbi:MAG: radical SAM protein [Patescibacteria group bacterium]
MSRNGIKDLSISGGGEPFLSPDIDGILDAALDSGLRIRSITNGNVLKESTVERLLRTFEIRFSVDTPDAETYSKTRRTSPKMLSRTFENISRLVKARNLGGHQLEIGATCIIGPENKEQLERFADIMLGELGIDHVIYKTDIYGNVKPNAADTELVENQLKATRQKYGTRVDIRPDLGVFISGLSCVESHFKSVINPYGELFSCCLGAQPGETNGAKYGSVKAEIRGGNTNALTTIWRQTKDLRETMRRRVGCTNCNFTDREINGAFIDFRNNIPVIGS